MTNGLYKTNQIRSLRSRTETFIPTYQTAFEFSSTVGKVYEETLGFLIP